MEIQMTIEEKKLYDSFIKNLRQRKEYNERRNRKIKLLLAKCKQKGIVVTDSEVDLDLKKNP